MHPSPAPARRLFLSQSGRVTLSAAAVTLLAGTGGAARAQPSSMLDVVVAFQAHHMAQRDTLIATIAKLGASR